MFYSIPSPFLILPDKKHGGQGAENPYNEIRLNWRGIRGVINFSQAD